ncbi:MAG: MFS transporter [Betaproteobacteria bacterium]|nr:MAG: MFS transporter [Betaproteobacteria bacterium]
MHPPARLAWSIWALGATLYLAGFFQRVAPAVMTQELMAEFAIAAAGLGNLSAFYFYSYVAMQIPTGLMVDRYGARRVLTSGAGIAALGGALFALAPSLALAHLGRLLIGGAVGVAWVGTLKLAGHWLPPQRFALASGLSLAAGMTGAVTAGVPLRWAVGEFGWRPVMLFGAVAIALVCAAIWWLVRDDPSERGYRAYVVARLPAGERPSAWRGLAEVLRHRNSWLAFFAPQGVTGAILSFGGLWGVPYLVAVYGFSVQRAAFYCSALMLAWALGGPVFGAMSDRLRQRKPLYAIGAFSSLVLWSIVFLAPRPLGPNLLLAMLIAAGFCSGCMVIGFAFAKESVPARYAGTATGVANMGSMTGAMLQQPLIGWILDRNWHGTLLAGVRAYDASAYAAGFLLVLAWLVVSVAAALLTRETHARQCP